jgi:transglutaminase-like putative cysteine protease
MELLKKQATERTTYLKATKLLDFNTPIIQQLVEDRGWRAMNTVQAVGSIYDFVRDEILFGYNTDDAISASQVLTDGYGQCNTKANLFMALLRSAGIPNRIHGFTINKALQKGAITGIWYQLAPENILHSWVELYLLVMNGSTWKA